jgi:tRNA threonylcarbamoyl adenosine modification protein YeaZ
MNVLGIDTSSTSLSVSLCVDGSPVSVIDRYVKNSHAEHIAQTVAMSIAMGGIEANDVARIAVSAGPGSFTGLRIGLAFVKGFCMAAEREVLPLSSLFVLAHAAVHGGFCNHERVFTALDARQGRVHWGGFVCEGCDRIRRLTEDRLSLPEALRDELSPDDILITDTMGYPRSTVFGAFEGTARIVNAESSPLRRGLSCAAIAFDRIDGGKDNNDEFFWRPASQIVPNYLQMSAAEEKRALCI